MTKPTHAIAPRGVPSSADWTHLRITITELYQNRRWTMADIAHYLRSGGYRVNTRMVRARISQWNLQRNHQLRDMVAALRLLDPNPAMWPTQEPRFLIRGRSVTMSEILHFFKRKGIPNPTCWAWSYPVSQQNSDVVLIGKEFINVAIDGRLSTTLIPHRDRTNTFQSCSLHVPILTQEERAVASLHSYCSAYLRSGGVIAHKEPPVHRSTTHGRFGGHMQEGLARIVQGFPNAFSEIDQGFDSVRALLADCHPMGLAQILTVSCNLATHGAQALLVSLLRHTASMASLLHMPEPVVSFLSALQASQSVLPVAISSLRAASGAFAADTQPSWQKFYMLERLCDCLHHCNEQDEGAAYRASLYASQEQFYGPFARNVLRTLNHVANDQLHSGNLDMAKVHYTTVVARAGCLQGSGQAQIRFVALEGLARVEQRRAKEFSVKVFDIAQNAVTSYIKSFHHINDALFETLACSELSGQRLSRARDRQRHILGHLTGIDQQSLTQELRDKLQATLRFVPA